MGMGGGARRMYYLNKGMLLYVCTTVQRTACRVLVLPRHQSIKQGESKVRIHYVKLLMDKDRTIKLRTIL